MAWSPMWERQGPLVEAIDNPRFVGGHDGRLRGARVDGATADLFAGAVWALTPTDSTAPDALAMVHGVVRSLGAEVLTMDPRQHDWVVATVSHVPHITAATLMAVADDRAVEHVALKWLAAGGFRDMTRIAAGDPGSDRHLRGQPRSDTRGVRRAAGLARRDALDRRRGTRR
ncbi:MAG: prephenate dehydrogenase dimerization domain-containing protein [Microthrixaceae bacterium]